MSKPHPDGAAAEDQTGRFVTKPNGRPRPLSPHMQIWRWHVTMAASILFRVTIGAASVGAILVTAWLGAVAFGPGAHAAVTGFMGSPPGLLIGFGLTVVLFSFFLNGARHTINDTGNGLTPKTSNLLSWISVIGPVVLAAGFWAALMGAPA